MEKEKIKCLICGKTLFFAKEADLEIKCGRCKQINIVYKEDNVFKSKLKE